MTPDLVRRLDSARMSALFTESLANREDGEFLSPRTELTIEDVRRLRLDQDEKRTTPGSLVAKALRKTPLLKLKKKKKEEEPKHSIPEKSEVRGSFDMALLMETGDAESWLVSSPSAAGGNKDIEEFLSRGDQTNRSSSYSRPPRSTAAASDAKSSLIGDPPLSPELKAVTDDGRSSPLPSRIPRGTSESPVSDFFDHDTPLIIEPEAVAAAPVAEPKRKSFAFSRATQQASGGQEAPKSRLKLPRFGRSIPSPPPSICSDRSAASPSKMSGQAIPIRRASSVISSLSETPDVSGIASPRSEILLVQNQDDREEGVTVFGRKKRLSFSGSKSQSYAPKASTTRAGQAPNPRTKVILRTPQVEGETLSHKLSQTFEEDFEVEAKQLSEMLLSKLGTIDSTTQTDAGSCAAESHKRLAETHSRGVDVGTITVELAEQDNGQNSSIATQERGPKTTITVGDGDPTNIQLTSQTDHNARDGLMACPTCDIAIQCDINITGEMQAAAMTMNTRTPSLDSRTGKSIARPTRPEQNPTPAASDERMERRSSCHCCDCTIA